MTYLRCILLFSTKGLPLRCSVFPNPQFKLPRPTVRGLGNSTLKLKNRFEMKTTRHESGLKVARHKLGLKVAQNALKRKKAKTKMEKKKGTKIRKMKKLT